MKILTRRTVFQVRLERRTKCPQQMARRDEKSNSCPSHIYYTNNETRNQSDFNNVRKGPSPNNFSFLVFEQSGQNSYPGLSLILNLTMHAPYMVTKYKRVDSTKVFGIQKFGFLDVCFFNRILYSKRTTWLPSFLMAKIFISIFTCTNEETSTTSKILGLDLGQS